MGENGESSDHNVVDLDDLDAIVVKRLAAYLAGPMTGLHPDAEFAARQIRAISRRVLAARFNVYDPAEFTAPGSRHTCDDVFLTDHSRVRNSDLVFFHLLSPSLGVGIEAQIAAESTLPRIVAYPSGCSISRMFKGIFCPTIAEIEYSDVGDFESRLSAAFPAILTAAKNSAAARKPILEKIANCNFGIAVFKSRVLLKLSLEEFARRTDIREGMLRRVELDQTAAATLTWIQLTRIAQTLNATILISSGMPALQGPADEPHVDEIQAASLQSLYACLAAKRSHSEADDSIFAAWDFAFPLAGSGVIQAARGEDPTATRQPVSAERWEAILAAVRAKPDEPTLFPR